MPLRGVSFDLDVRRSMSLNARYRFVLLCTVGWDRITAAAEDINQAIEDGAFRVGEEAGLPLHRLSLEETAAGHAAVESGAVGKVLVTVGVGLAGEHCLAADWMPFRLGFGAPLSGCGIFGDHH